MKRPHSSFSRATLAVLGLLLLPVASLTAQDDEQAAEGPKYKVKITNLENPSGLAIDPETGHVFIASRFGVYRYDPAKHTEDVPKGEKLSLMISGYPTDIYGKGPEYKIGPLGLAIKGNWLIVGDGSRPDSEELVRIYEIKPEMKSDDSPIKEDEAAFTLGPIEAGDLSDKGEGNFYGVAVIGDRIFITSNGDDTKGWILKSDIEDNKPGELTGFVATKELLEVDAPAAATVSPDGTQLVVSQMGEINIPGDSLLTFYNPEDGTLIRSLETGLSDIIGLAYSPKSGKLYATEFSWIDESQGGLFRLDIEGDTVTPVKIMSLDKPAALAFDKEGETLYVTVFGSVKEGAEDDDSPGTLIAVDASDF
jgi:DNA-binding beta-propeller fold protein YncE